MSKLEELIQKLCPHGVEYKTLGEIAVNMFRGSGIKRDQVTEEGIPCVRYGEIYTTYGIWFDQCVSHTQLSYVSSPKYFEHGDILFAVTGESVEDIAKSCAYMGNEKCLAGGDIVVLKHEQNPKYLSYALATTDAKMQKSKGKVKSKVVHASVPSLKQIKIPVPPLPVQCEIVRILDNFTELTAELTAELAVRKKQYAYYRNKLITFDKEHPLNSLIHTLCSQEIEYRSIGEIAKTLTAKIKVKSHDYLENGKYPIVDQGKEYIGGYTDQEGAFPQREYVIFGDHTCVVKFVDFPFVQGADGIKVIIPKDERKVICKYLYYCMSSIKMAEEYTRHWTKMRSCIIPVPPVFIQEKIVSILDCFDTLCNDLAEGLPAEIEARKKQYEYYRDKLLSFPQRKQ